jgi:hypothetical protein
LILQEREAFKVIDIQILCGGRMRALLIIKQGKKWKTRRNNRTKPYNLYG